MNCSQGDMCLIIRSRAGNEGRVVSCVKFVGTIPDIKVCNFTIGFEHEDYWEVDQYVNGQAGKGKVQFTMKHVRDSYMIPIGKKSLDEETNQQSLTERDNVL